MRLCTYILATFFLFLSVQPGVDAFSMEINELDTCCTVQCNISSTGQNEDNLPKEGCEDRSCNPFKVCSSTVLFCTKQSVEEVFCICFRAKKVFVNATALIAQFEFEFWQPPKIV